MIFVLWPSRVARSAEVWRVLDLGRLTKSTREARNFVKSGYVSVDGRRVQGLKDTIEIGKPTKVSVQFPNGRKYEYDITVVNRMFSPERKPRSSGAAKKNYKG